MFGSFLAFSSLLLIGSARAQVNAPNCTDSSFSWSYNSLQQNPCWVASYLAATCNDGVFAIPALLPQHSYTGPNGPDNSDLCKCNTVVYNLISACDACQGESWIPYSTWSYNCTASSPPGSFANSIPAGTIVPHWAYLDTSSTGDTWNITTAQLAGGTAPLISTSTRATQSTLSPGATSPVPSTQSNSSSKSSSNAGAIAGGVVGGVVGAALIAGIVVWFVIRRRRARSAPSTTYMSGQGGDMSQVTSPYPLFIESPKLYDPSDPSTYPTHGAPSPTIRTTNQSNQYHGSTSELQPNRQAYSGLPEV
ncbi:hypothetical protein B0F90DRAFT_732901 [Multifurca ochricompacta]|uniref:Uncharacterized protein n=1 Tax=Multifurca ochricompacta TaxID=376703 RepID=A0AAD4QRU7_9AGAM|nr:hypothetical protein B0F90DRAFT_732901 [Multifurca ochricompacta]